MEAQIALKKDFDQGVETCKALVASIAQTEKDLKELKAKEKLAAARNSNAQQLDLKCKEATDALTSLQSRVRLLENAMNDDQQQLQILEASKKEVISFCLLSNPNSRIVAGSPSSRRREADRGGSTQTYRSQSTDLHCTTNSQGR